MDNAGQKFIDQFIQDNPGASRREIHGFIDQKCKELINLNQFQEASVLMNSMLDRLQQRGTKIAEAMAPLRAVKHPINTGPSIGSGISAGKVTAICAGVGLLAAGAYAWFHHGKKQDAQLESSPSWVDRVAQQRAGQFQNRGI